MNVDSGTCSFSSNALALFCPKQKAISSPYHFQIYDSVDLIPWAEWHQYIHPEQFFMQVPYLQGVERAQPDINFRYVLIYQHKQLMGIAYFQVVNFSVSKIKAFTQDESATDFWDKVKMFFSQRMKDVASSFDVNLLVCGNVFISGEYSFAHLPSLSKQEAFQILMETCEYLYRVESKTRPIRGILVKDCILNENSPTSIFEETGFHPFVVEPMMEMYIMPEWKSFKDYQDALSSKYRQRQKSVEKKSSVLISRELTLQEIEQNTAKMYHFFQSVVSKAGFNMQNPAEAYMLHLKKSLGDKIKITGYFLENELVGFMSVIRANHVLEAHFLGYEDETNHNYKIYQRILYDIVRIAIDEKFSKISFGRTAMEIKTTVGAVPHDMQLYLKLMNPVINRLAKPVMRNIKTEKWEPRHPFKNQVEEELSSSSAKP